MTSKPENGQQAANNHNARQTNTQRIRFVRTTIYIDGNRRHILTPTTQRDRVRALPDSSPYLAQRR
jgi:hypothetical protein